MNSHQLSGLFWFWEVVYFLTEAMLFWPNLQKCQNLMIPRTITQKASPVRSVTCTDNVSVLKVIIIHVIKKNIAPIGLLFWPNSPNYKRLILSQHLCQKNRKHVLLFTFCSDPGTRKNLSLQWYSLNVCAICYLNKHFKLHKSIIFI
jgi:hypothetical protein